MTRRTLAAVAATSVAATAVLSGCDTGRGAAGSTPTVTSPHVPLTTTSTTEPTSSTRPTAPPSDKPDPPGAKDLLRMAKDRMTLAQSVTIDGVVHDKQGPIEIHAEGSAGKGGNSLTRMTIEGGTIEYRVIGFDKYVRADKVFLEGRLPRDHPWRKHADAWVAIPWDDDSLDHFRPAALVRASFFGEGLTTWDAHRATSATFRLDGSWAFRLQMDADSKGGRSPVREIWTTADTRKPQVQMLSIGAWPSRSEYRFTRWDATPQDTITKPDGAVRLDEGNLLEDEPFTPVS